MFSIDTERLINAIKNRPALYKRDNELYYTHRKNKDRIWREVCEEVNQNWNQLSQQHKADCVRELQKRWKSLRTCFSRELCYQRKEKMKRDTDQNVKRRKRYEYFNNLLFLIDGSNENDDGRESDDSDPLDNNYQPEETVYDYGESSNDFRNLQNMKIEIESPASHFPKEQSVYDRNITLEAKFVDMLKDFKADENDEDRLFMLSLVPSFRQLSMKQKITAKIEILKVLQRLSDQDE